MTALSESSIQIEGRSPGDVIAPRDNPYAAPGFGPPALHLEPPPGLELPL
ncbi:hypothetical protein [Candidatus Solirubrobacter pratensis]|nr:hypothetical protein [Candidatus Solirubrobacter pratensis]